MTALFAVSCEQDTVKVERILIANPSPLTLRVGDTDTLRVNIVPATATNQNYEVLVEDQNVLSVSEDNLITALAAGNTTITAKAEDGGFFAVLEVVVKEALPEVDFTIEQKALDAFSVTVGVTPSDLEVSYFVEQMDREMFDTYASAEEACGSYIKMYKDMAMLDSRLYTGVQDITLFSQPETEYIVMAVGYVDGQMLSNVKTFTYTTPADEGEDEVTYDIDFKGVSIVMEDYSGDGTEILYNIYDIPVEDVVDETLYVSLDVYPKEPYKFDGTFGPDDFYLGFSAYLSVTWETFEAFDDCNMTVTKKDDGTYDLLATGVLQNGKTIRVTYSGAISF